MVCVWARARLHLVCERLHPPRRHPHGEHLRVVVPEERADPLRGLLERAQRRLGVAALREDVPLSDPGLEEGAVLDAEGAAPDADAVGDEPPRLGEPRRPGKPRDGERHPPFRRERLRVLLPARLLEPVVRGAEPLAAFPGVVGVAQEQGEAQVALGDERLGVLFAHHLGEGEIRDAEGVCGAAVEAPGVGGGERCLQQRRAEAAVRARGDDAPGPRAAEAPPRGAVGAGDHAPGAAAERADDHSSRVVPRLAAALVGR